MTKAKSLRPTSVRIGSFDWTIDYLEHSDWHTEGRDEIGTTEADQLKILVRLSDEKRSYHIACVKETLLHELLHAIYAFTGLTFYATAKNEKDQEEHTVRSLTPSFLAVMRENPDLVKWLIED